MNAHELLREAERLGGQGDAKGALELWGQALPLLDQAGDARGRAVVLIHMGRFTAQLGDAKRALDLWEQSLVASELANDATIKAAALHHMAGALAGQGDAKRALGLWKQTLTLLDLAGDTKAKLGTLLCMADFLSKQQGEGVAQALDVWGQALVLFDQLGDVKGKAATLGKMAWAAGQEGDLPWERQLNLEAARVLAKAEAWTDLIGSLGNVGGSAESDAQGFLAQALWLSLRVAMPLENLLGLCGSLFYKLGPGHESSPWIATFGLYKAQFEGEEHPRQGELHELAWGMVTKCAAARGVAPDKIRTWMTAQGMNDPSRIPPALEHAVEALVAPAAWLFDRQRVPGAAGMSAS
ncbi:MAG: hypothetical protein HYZ53_00195 [Planctomycetes bacterium]|nr:hypothetical protein [Planctomycetota bacterium]